MKNNHGKFALLSSAWKTTALQVARQSGMLQTPETFGTACNENYRR